jgi:hypothetical protein
MVINVARAVTSTYFDLDHGRLVDVQWLHILLAALYANSIAVRT